MRHLCDRVVRQVATHRLKTTALKGHSQYILTTGWTFLANLMWEEWRELVT